MARDSTPDLLDVDAAPLRDRIPIPAVDYLTEYFLMGSLISWTLALAPSLLFRP